MHCPSCIVDLKITERQGVEIDYCPQCRGVWLDRGELDKIIERSAGFLPEGGRQRESSAGRFYDDDDDDRMYSKSKKRKRGSFLEELFDFG